MTVQNPGEYYDRFKAAHDSGDSAAADQYGLKFIEAVSAFEITEEVLRPAHPEGGAGVSLEWLREKRDEVRALLGIDHGTGVDLVEE
ncbi:MAG TPA: hypothetical protein VFD58_36255 [Blastocatellia bacterium]|nr:hypothetical protein [Blastocatellia bacterium]